ncbi:transposase [Streptomyces sp. NPDC058051]|uniref:IS701 family transposase n=1 Tax=Streptomyces sp. NPDC058051 TaxID=3346315 RepID=UPI0036EAA7DF
MRFAWLTAGEAYGQVRSLRYWFEQRGVFRVLATRRTDIVVTSSRMDHPVDELVVGLPRQAGKRRSCGRGAHGERVYDWARAPIRPWREEGVEHWVLARRSITDPTEVAYYVCFAPEGTSLNTLLTVACRRWTIEECFRTAKNECGLDHYRVRKYHARYRHIALATAAHAYLTTVRGEELKKMASESGEQHLVPLSLAEIRRLTAHLTARLLPPFARVLHWSHWRRQAQHRALVSHYKQRGHSP